MIKNITDTSIEIPEETEVIDVCKSMSKAIEDLLKESREQGIEIGKIQTLVRLVQKGDLKIERAAVNVQDIGVIRMYQIL